MQERTYLNDVIIPFHKSQALVDDNFILYDINGRLLVTSKRIVCHLGFKDHQDILGKRITEFEHITPAMIPKLDQIFLTVRDKKRIVTCLAIGGQSKPLFKNHHEIVLQRYEPVVDLEENVIAILARGLPLLEDPLINLAISEFSSQFNIKPDLSEKLSTREFEIFYLLSHGFSQYQIGSILKITRSTVAKTIERIHDKLKLEITNSQDLIKLSITMGMNNKIPRSLVHEKLVILPC